MSERYVVCALIVGDTAVIEADSPEAAAEMYEMPEELKDKDVMLWAVSAEEFYATINKAKEGDVIAAAEEAIRQDGCNLRDEL